MRALFRAVPGAGVQFLRKPSNFPFAKGQIGTYTYPKHQRDNWLDHLPVFYLNHDSVYMIPETANSSTVPFQSYSQIYALAAASRTSEEKISNVGFLKLFFKFMMILRWNDRCLWGHAQENDIWCQGILCSTKCYKMCWNIRCRWRCHQTVINNFWSEDWLLVRELILKLILNKSTILLCQFP